MLLLAWLETRRARVGGVGGRHTDRSTADDGHLALFLLRGHGVGGRRALAAWCDGVGKRCYGMRSVKV